MLRSIILLLLLLAFLSYQGLAEAQAINENLLGPVTFNDIRFDEEPPVAGSGSGKLPYSDDEDLNLSGSGSGSGQGSLDSVEPDIPTQTTQKMKKTTIESTTTTDKPSLSACEHIRKTSLMIGRKFIPNCVDGVYASIQCADVPGESDCWCSDKIGKAIPGTVMEPPNMPDCDDGSNLSPCLHQLVKAVRSDLLGSPKPQCTKDGQFHPIQCSGSVCYCVDKDTGVQDISTIVHRPDIPRCSDDIGKGIDEIANPIEPIDTTKRPKVWTNGSILITPDDFDSSEIEIPDTDYSDETYDVDNGLNEVVKGGSYEEGSIDEDLDEDESDENKIDPGTEDKIKPDRYHDKETKIEKANRIMSQPGLLAGIIGGSVVVALCLVLLIMFIIYRIRKKDAGSYPLEEPRKPPKYPYMRAPEREFYA